MVAVTFNPPSFIQTHHIRTDEFAAELAQGLGQGQAMMAPKFFYDELGSGLFNAITALPEYYPTRTEAAIFARHSADMARHVPARSVMIDLGAGCCTKAARLFPSFQPQAYVAVDISVEFLRATLHHLAPKHPKLHMLGLGMDFSSRLAWPSEAHTWLQERQLAGHSRLLFYPGSSIGNFNPEQALAFLRQAHALCQEGGPDGGLLIGFDLVKEKAVLEAAYDDSLGVTAAFNRNVLAHANAILGSDFDPRLWAHVAFFNQVESRIEMHLQSRRRQTVRWPAGERTFEEGERIHTENSYKWTPAALEDLLRQAGFKPVRQWRDERDWFSLAWARAHA